ncbi:GNAT family N-acetyltransferase [Staphylococcus arlettae]|jgi:ribosomal protein S18 acetylase RimI-like enzyme|uniref:GCN5-related N-acetyltransferase n=1 Tax=Staphylococcus arlettae TaxID=29378 RepID=A0A2T7BV57_9STAP|nr:MULTISPECIES: GNAT family N-acetyltransferase [Staphylococcus]EJY95287.1 putative acetyltransferase [Staphylococcus arlettae CVD059]ERF48949.1 hypothetical protein N039_01360 [Staphylococcus sp. EGD-HP3]KAB2481020.1 GNAT family N-acetyltransferase [Staphylococcus sp. CH99b_3]MCD8815405.1 GNAT family N-acetyltransferase [Staphylococcus arlettae]MCD8839319.1 GNAT family N-acetyltransferase [Staphylococcus arlettae]
MEMRIANKNDIETIIELRKAQLLDQGMLPTVNIDDNMKQYFEEVFEKEHIYQIFLIDNGEIVSTGAVVIQQIPPAYDNYTGQEGYITNVYTKQAYRGLGLGKQVIDQLIKQCKMLDVNVVNLKASSDGAHLYSKIGFFNNPTSMTLELAEDDQQAN